MAALLAKVGVLLLKQIAKPLSAQFQAYVMANPVPRSYAIAASQSLHRMEVWITRRAEGKTGKAFVGDMTEEKSLELASKLASEGFVFGVGILLIGWEYDRQRRKEVLKKQLEEQERLAVLEQAQRERERLTEENLEQTRLIKTLQERMEALDKDIQLLMSEARKVKTAPKGMFGGFFGPRAPQLTQAAS